jgi:hypothetical protein
MDSASILRVIYQDVSKVCVHATSLWARILSIVMLWSDSMRLVVASLLILFAWTNAHSIISSGNHAVPPESGVWWNPNQPGVGYSVDVDRRGNAFIAWHTYRADGTSTFYTLGGKVSRTSESSGASNCDDRSWTQSCGAAKLSWHNTGITAILKSPIYAVENGGCPVCTPRFPVVTQSPLGPAEVRFFGSRNAEIHIQGAVLPIRMQDIATSFGDLTDVKWLVSDRFSAQIVSPYLVVGSFVRTDLNVSGLIYNGYTSPPASAVIYKYQSSGGVVRLPGSQEERVLYVASDESSNRLHVYITKETFNAILGTTRSVVVSGELFRYRDRMIAWLRGVGFPITWEIHFEEQASY